MTPQSGGKASELVNRVLMHMLQSLAGLVSKYSRKLIRVSTLPSIVATEGGEWRDNDAWHTREACWLAWYDIRSKGCRQGSSWWRQRCEGAFSAPQGSWRQWRRQWRQYAAMMSGKPNDSGGTQYLQTIAVCATSNGFRRCHRREGTRRAKGGRARDVKTETRGGL